MNITRLLLLLQQQQIPNLHFQNLLRTFVHRKMSTADARPLLISVVGATGTGKSNIAIDLALALSGEIINADAMQLYAGLPIITNKVTTDEARGVPHHLLGVLDVRDAWQVGRFVSEASKIITEIHSRGKIPIVVGGTHYYIQSLLYPSTLTSPTSSDPDPDPDIDADPDPDPEPALTAQYPILSDATPTADLHAHLTSIDPQMASRWHPHDRRKILRSLTIYYSTGLTPSALYASQPAPKSPYRNLVFWVHASPDILRARLDARVDDMMVRGMGLEIEAMKTLVEGEDVDTTTGIWQSIGFKEFLPFLTRRADLGLGPSEYSIASASASNPPHPPDTTTELSTLLSTALSATKTATRQYAKSQLRWIRQKLHPTLADDNVPVYVLDSSSPSRFVSEVARTAVSIACSFVRCDGELPEPRGVGALAAEMLGEVKREVGDGERWGQRTCGVCETVCVGEEQWRSHVRSNRHKKAVGREKRGEAVERWRAWEVERRGWREGGCVGPEPPRPEVAM